jgi:ABC-type lipoprotein release transport system permease subunit
MPLPLYYNWRNLLRRRLSTALTFVVVAVVVFVLSALLAFAAGISASLAASGSSRNILVLKPGATAESTSLLLHQEVARLHQTPGLAREADGAPLLSQELCIQTSIPRRGPNGTLANVAVRGVDEVALKVHSEVRWVEGRMFRAGAMEIVVGKAARDRYANLELGGAVELGRLTNRSLTVVGVFDAAGGALESEIWGPRTLLVDIYAANFSSSVALRLAETADPEEAIKYITGPAVELEARRETDYYKDLSTKTREIVVLAVVLVGIMGVGAAFAVANTMFAAVDGRRREIAMLRTIGFGRGAILAAFLIESLLVSTFACALGLGGSLFLNGSRQDFLSDTTWTVLAYELRVTPAIAASALGVALLVGLIGAAAPAFRASRIRVIEALRKA